MNLCLSTGSRENEQIKVRTQLWDTLQLPPYFQGPTCQPSQLDCVSKVVVDDTDCPKSCSGILITGYSHFGPQEYSNHVTAFLSKLSVAYGKYKGMHDFHKNFQGRIFNYSSKMSQRIFFFLEYEWKKTLRYVRIYFETPTFDRITKDRAAKFVDMLSAIGGTMGLLTGFSIISAVEILYFTFKILNSFIKIKKQVSKCLSVPNMTMNILIVMLQLAVGLFLFHIFLTFNVFFMYFD